MHGWVRDMPARILSARSSTESMQSSSSGISEPDKLMPAVAGPMVWEGTELNPQDYVVELLNSDIENIRAAVVSFKLRGLDRSQITRETFPLSSGLVTRLSDISTGLHRGKGVSVLRGLEAARFNDEEAVIAFAGVCSYVAAQRATDAYANQTLSHIRDATKQVVPVWAKGMGLAGSKITAAMDFHSDRFSGDILTMHVRNDGGPESGGEQYVASFWRIYNELLRSDPEVLETMAESNWPFELKQKDREPYLELGPTLFFSNGVPICQLVKAPLLGTPQIPRTAGMPTLTAAQEHALDAVETMARRFCTNLDRRQGDIQFVNNLSVLHARAAYRGQGGASSTRHMLRMFLRDPTHAWKKPAAFQHKFDGPFAPGRVQTLSILDTDPWRAISGRESHG